jgi:hypothetical protein
MSAAYMLSMAISGRHDEADLVSGDGKSAATLIERIKTMHSRL